MEQSRNLSAEAMQELVKDLGMDILSEDKRNELLIKMTEVLLKRIFIETMEKLGEQGRDEYEEIIQQSPQPEELDAFFADRITDYDELVRKIIVDFKNEMSNVSSKVK